MAITKAKEGDHNITTADTEEDLFTAFSAAGVYQLVVKTTDLADGDHVIVRGKKQTDIARDAEEAFFEATYVNVQENNTKEFPPITLEGTDTLVYTVEASNAADNFIFALYQLQ